MSIRTMKYERPEKHGPKEGNFVQTVSRGHFNQAGQEKEKQPLKHPEFNQRERQSAHRKRNKQLRKLGRSQVWRLI